MMPFFVITVILIFAGIANAQTSISTCSQLQNISSDTSGEYVLAADINCAGFPFIPIANFTGTLDGQGHTVSNLTINRPGLNQIGLFASIMEAGHVQDLVITNAQINGQAQVGVLTGYMFVSTVSNVSVKNSQVTGASQVGGLIGESYNGNGISNAQLEGVTVVGSSEVGGLVGRIWDGNENNISQSSVKTTVIATGDSIGGIAGYSKSGDFIESYSEGSVQGNINVGGIVGQTFENAGIHNSYSQSMVTGSAVVGGIAGHFNSYDDGVSNTYFAGTVSGSSQKGGFLGQYIAGAVSSNYWDMTLNPLVPGVGSGDIPGISGKTTAEMFQQNTFVGWDFNTIWSMAGAYPRLDTLSLPDFISQVTFSKTAGGNGNVTSFSQADDFHISLQNIAFNSSPGTTFVVKACLVENDNHCNESEDNAWNCNTNPNVICLNDEQIDNLYVGSLGNLEQFQAGPVLVILRVTIPGVQGPQKKVLVHRSWITITE